MNNKKVVEVLDGLRITIKEARDATKKEENRKALNKELFALKIDDLFDNRSFRIPVEDLDIARHEIGLRLDQLINSDNWIEEELKKFMTWVIKEADITVIGVNAIEVGKLSGTMATPVLTMDNFIKHYLSTIRSK